MKRKLLLAALCVVGLLGGRNNAFAQASYNVSYTDGVEVAAGSELFLYNIGGGVFLSGGMDWGSHAAGDHGGKMATLALSEGAYTIQMTYYSANGLTNDGYLGSNQYTDAGDAAKFVFTPVEVAGYTNAYTIKNGDNFLYYNASDTRINLGASTGDNYSYWLIIPRSARNAKKDYTYYIQNPGINRFWERACWAGCTWSNDKFSTGGNANNPCGEKYHATLDFYQTMSASVPNGKYTLYAQGFYRQDDSATEDAPYLYANEDKQNVATKTGSEDNMNDASTSFSAGNYVNSVTTTITNNNLKVGINITGSHQWVIWDNFHLQLVTPAIEVVAVELPAGGAMVANTWYYYDVTVADNYNATATTLGDIVYTTNGVLLEDDASITANFAATDNGLSATRYYVKSSSDNNLVIAPASYTYVVGDPTPSVADNKYTQSNSFTLTYSSATTNDPDGTFQVLDASKITVNSAAATASITDNVLTITLANPLAASTDYAISVAAGAVGYNAGAANTAFALAVKTPAVFDGHYYIKKDGADLYFSRGGDENKQTVLDQFGVPVKITTDGSNVSRVKFVDTGLLLGASGSSNMYWTDKGDGTPSTVDWTIAKSGDKFKFYLTGMSDDKKGMNIEGSAPKSDTEANACDWELELPAAHPAKLQAVKDAQAASVATAMSIDGVSTQAQMKTYVEDNYGETSIAITGTGGTNKEAWQQTAPITDPYEYAVFAEETVDGLTPGLYRLRVYGFERIADGQSVYDAGGAAGLAYVYATSNSVTEKVKLASLFDVQSDTPWKSGNDLQFGGKYYPNGQAGAQAAFDAGNYANDVYVKVVDEGDGTGSIKFGIKQPNAYYSGSSVHNNYQWICYNNFSLVKFDNKATDSEKEALGNAIAAANAKTLGFDNGEYAPYNNVEALEALAAAKEIAPSTATSIAVVAATNVLTDATWTANAGEVNAFGDPLFANSGNDGAQLGWVTDHANGLGGAYHSRAFVLTSGMTNYENLAAFGQGDGTRSAGYFRFDNTNSSKTTVYTYGTTAGYTLPLKASLYKVTAQVGGWGQVDKDIKLAVVDGEGTEIASQTVKTPTTGVNAGGSVVDFDFVVNITSAGNYKIQLTNGSSEDQAVALSNMEMVKATSATMVITDAKWATFVAPFDVTIPAGVTAYNVTGVSGTSLLKTEVETTIPANKPVLLNSESLVNETFYGKAVAGTPTYGILTGVYADQAATVGTYVLQKQGDYVNFYQVASGEEPTVSANRAYLTAPSSAKMLSFDFDEDGEATQIAVIESETAKSGVAYNLAGQPVGSNYKGIVIKNGKKLLQK